MICNIAMELMCFYGLLKNRIGSVEVKIDEIHGDSRRRSIKSEKNRIDLIDIGVFSIYLSCFCSILLLFFLYWKLCWWESQLKNNLHETLSQPPSQSGLKNLWLIDLEQHLGGVLSSYNYRKTFMITSFVVAGFYFYMARFLDDARGQMIYLLKYIRGQRRLSVF